MTTNNAKKIEPGIYKDQHGRRIEVMGTLANDQVVYTIGTRSAVISRPMALKLWTKVEPVEIKPSGKPCPPVESPVGGNRIAAGTLLAVALAAVWVFVALLYFGKVEW